MAADRVSVSGLSNNEPVDGFIVRYRDGSESKASVATQQRSLNQAASTAFGRAKALTLKHERTLGIGAELVQTDRPLDRTEAETLMRQIATNPDVEFVEPNLRVYPTLTPNDTFYNLQTGQYIYRCSMGDALPQYQTVKPRPATFYAPDALAGQGVR